MTRIFLNKKRSKNSVNEENHLNIQLNSECKILPPTDIETSVNAYEQYLNEKKNSQTYRLSFNIIPLCSNVLFNKISEIAYHEGGDDCVVFNNKNASRVINDNNYIKNYCDYKKISTSDLTRSILIRDTGFSHPECGGVVYHCGYDIFNNHTLRRKEFNTVNKLSKVNYLRREFNTLYDFKRDKDGNNIFVETFDENGDEKPIKEHLYLKDDIYTFEESINENLIETNGWLGFINPTSLNMPNYETISLNKCMNNNKACEMIDMYPDRSLFSFIPKINKYRENRVENNWDYCLTYPFKNFYDNELVTYECKNGTKVNGLKVKIIDDIFGSDFIDEDEISVLTLKTIIKHNFVVGDKINVVLIGNDSKGEERIVTLDNDELITKVGYEGKNKEYYFSIYGEELISDLNSFASPSQVEIRVQKMTAYGPCEYYFRKFRRIPNLNHINILNDNINEEEIKKYSNMDFNSTLNNLGFSRTIYNDKNAQLLFNDDIKLNGLVDNLGREISEIYLTIVKNNKGHKEWYEDKVYTGETITNSRCFGKITSGVEMLDRDNFDYNIHTINNVSSKIITYESGTTWDSLVKYYYQNFFNIKEDLDGNKVYEQPKVLEDDINIHGTSDSGNNEFLGDIVEFNKTTLTEHILCDVLHRFNTVQREILDEEYRDLMVDEIMYDDYDLLSGFTPEQTFYNLMKGENDIESEDERYIKVPFNIDAEGYYYKPHHKITLKRYKEKVNQGVHTKINYDNIRNPYEDDVYYLLTSKEYYLKKSDKLHFFNKNYEECNIGEVIDIKEDINFNKWLGIKVKLSDELENYSIFKIETINGVYELNDGSGRYLWRELLDNYDYNDEISEYIFTNNAHYINKNILFTLHRQDPNGEYGISGINAPTPIINNFTVGGDTNDYSDIETMLNEIEGGDLSC